MMVHYGVKGDEGLDLHSCFCMGGLLCCVFSGVHGIDGISLGRKTDLALRDGLKDMARFLL